MSPSYNHITSTDFGVGVGALHLIYIFYCELVKLLKHKICLCERSHTILFQIFADIECKLIIWQVIKFEIKDYDFDQIILNLIHDSILDDITMWSWVYQTRWPCKEWTSHGGQVATVTHTPNPTKYSPAARCHKHFERNFSTGKIWLLYPTTLCEL